MPGAGRGSQSSVTFPTQELTTLVEDVRRKIVDDTQEILDAIGRELLEKVRDAYIAKSRGGTGSDGIKWDAASNRALRRQTQRTRPSSGTKATHSKSAIGRKSGTGKKIGTGLGSREVGRSTGRQLDSLQPGKHGDQGDSLSIDQGSVTVRATMDYSRYFDEKRPIMPETIPANWLDDLEKLVLSHGEKILEAALNKV